MATKMRCPKCGQLNDPGASRCAQCRAPLTQTCPRCGYVRPWYVPRCPRCDVQVDDDAVFTSLFREGSSRRLQGRYLLREALSRDAVSVRYRAEDIQQPDTAYVVQELSTVALFRANERREAESALSAAVARWSAVDHPSVPAIIETFQAGEAHYVVSEWVPGTDLATLMAREGLRVTPDLARNWGAQLADLLDSLHHQHPPLFVPFLAPGRVTVQPDGRTRLADLGFACLFAPTADLPYGAVRGYAAPELESGPPTPQSDVFALGRLLYALLVGKLLERGLRRQLPLRQAVPGISLALVKTIARAAHRDPRQRFASAAELRQALWDASSGPLAPIEGWRELLAPIPGVARREMGRPSRGVPTHSHPAPGDAESMEALGFERDPRFGPSAAEPMGPGRTAAVTRDAPVEAPTRERDAALLAVRPRHVKASDLKPDDARRVVLTLRNTGTVDVTGRVSSHVAWLSAPKSAFRLPVGKQAKVILTVRADALPTPQVTEPRALSVDTNAGQQWVAVTAQVRTTPLLRVEPSLLDWGAIEGDRREEQRLTITNAGGQTMAGSVAARVPWLRVATPEFRCLPGRSVQVPVQLVSDEVPPGDQHVEAALVIDSDGGQERVAARVRRLVPALDLGVSHIDLGSVPAEATERYLYVGNSGDGVLEGSALPLVPWLRLAPQEFRCPPGEMVQLALIADLSVLGDGPVEVPQAVRVRTNGGVETLSLRATVVAPRLAVGGSDLAFGEARLGDVVRRTIVVANTGSAPLFATVQSLVEWLSASPVSLTCAPGEEQAVEVVADTTRFPRGEVVELTTALRIEAENATISLPASITVRQPALRVEPLALDFGYVERTQPQAHALTLANDGNGPLAWNVQTNVAWVEIAPTEGVCRPGQEQSITVTAYGLAADPEAEVVHGTLVINSDAGRAKLPMRLAFAAPLLSSDTTVLDLGVSVNLQDTASSFRLFNHGLGLLRGRITTDRTWLVVDRASFQCEMGRSIEVRIRTDLEELPPGTEYATGSILVESNGGDVAIDVALTIALQPNIEPPDALTLDRSAPAEPLQGRLALRNTGMATAHVELRPSVPQMVLSRNLLDIKPGKSVRIAVRWQGIASADTDAPYIDVLSGDASIRVPVIVQEEPN